MRHLRQIVSGRLVCGAKRRSIAHQQRPGPVWQEHSLVRIERQRVSTRQAVQCWLRFLAEVEKRAVGTVDVMPQVLGCTEIRERLQRIHGAGVRRAGARDDGKRREAGAAIVSHRFAQRFDRQPILLVARYRSDTVRHDPGQLGRLEHRVVCLIRGVECAASNIVAEVSLAGAKNGVERGHRAAIREKAARFVGKTHPVTQPVEGVGFELYQCRRRLPNTGVTVRRVGNEIGQGGRK